MTASLLEAFKHSHAVSGFAFATCATGENDVYDVLAGYLSRALILVRWPVAASMWLLVIVLLRGRVLQFEVPLLGIFLSGTGRVLFQNGMGTLTVVFALSASGLFLVWRMLWLMVLIGVAAFIVMLLQVTQGSVAIASWFIACRGMRLASGGILCCS